MAIYSKSLNRDDRVMEAVLALENFMDDHLAASKIELEAKLIDVHYSSPPFEPAHLHNATKMLLASEKIERVTEPTRGGGRPPLLVTTATAGRSRRVTDTAARKRLLMSRYYSYVQGGEEEASSSLAGPAGEAAFQSAFLRASIGASLAENFRDRTSVPRILGAAVPVGPLDNAFVLQPLDIQTFAPRPPWGTLALVEVKNIREWIYPRTQELYQVLYKSALIQRANPEANILPVLVCRRAHLTTKFMAKDLGFFVIEARRQYLPESSLIDPALLLEMTDELGINDLVQGTDASHTMATERALTTLQRKFDVQTSIDRWKSTSADAEVLRSFSLLIHDDLPNQDRDAELSGLRSRAHALGAVNGW